ncbi:type I restriction enzyme M protein [Lacrimispora sphenoides]|jgi:type I restriction enzyme M protein|uniref:restriction endonuclease subunit M n=1 Tax=Lacrimispora sphenoides TaxID=29370 RepID=UPI0008B81B53|nr:N-6 DNA methylase [Lacrimispora sphenoides]SEU22481.1 type I restriction enzyme M protein [Lacrimispora sphenoides]
MPKKIEQILKPEEASHISQFTQEDKDWINSRIHDRADGEPGVECVVRGKNDNGDYFKLTPEEIVRQYYAYKLIEVYGYTKKQLCFELPAVYAGKEIIKNKRIDIAVFNKDDKSKIDMIIEVKRPEIKDENVTADGESSTPFQQMQSYCRLKLPKIGVIANGDNLLKFYEAPAFDEALVIDKFPSNGEDIDEWKNNRRFTLKQLIQEDRLQTETLKDIILNVEQRFGANDSSDKAFEEIFKLIFIKLYDEVLSSQDADEIAIGMTKYHVALKDIDDSDFRVMRFRVKEDDSLDDVYQNMTQLFNEAKTKWPGVFEPDGFLDMQRATVKSCVKELQNVKLFNSNLEVIDDAFEHLVNQNQKEGMGQYFTPRYVIDMCVKILNPKPTEKMIDTAAGSCGFPMHSIFHVWKQLNPESFNLFTTRARKPEELAYVQNNVFGIDFSEKSVRVGRMLNIIAGDGHTNVIYLNSLDYPNWKKNFLEVDKWRGKYTEGFAKLSNLSASPTSHSDKKKYKAFNFDILMANPPFAGDLDNSEQLEIYDLGHNSKGKLQNKVGRDILFIERNLNFLKPGGRMAVVLPQGRFNNSGDKLIRDYISERCRILAVVGLHGNVFKPHTGTKTSVLFVQKWTDENCGFPNICPKPEPNADGIIDYPIFFATMQKPSKDNSGDKIYVTENYVTWNSYKYITETHYIRKSDKQEVTKEEYDSAEKKSDYTVKVSTRKEVEEHLSTDGSADFVKDLFISDHGELDSHKKWILKNVSFTLKNKKKDSDDYDENLSIEEFLALSEADQAHYKEVDILGENTHDLISLDEYNSLDKNMQKYYLIAEDVTERTERVKDTHGHIFVRHDLFNHDPELANSNPNNIYSQNGIAEAFAEFAKKEGLSFFQ